jgi:hypothetical protein
VLTGLKQMLAASAFLKGTPTMSTVSSTLTAPVQSTSHTIDLTYFSESPMRDSGYIRRAIVEGIVAVAMFVTAGLLFWGGSFATDMVHDQLSDQRITFPAKGSPAMSAEDNPGLQRYGGQAVDNGPKAKAYANQFIGGHLKETNEGKTYSETSAQSRAARAEATAAKEANAANAADLDAKATVLEGKTQTLFRGETLRGLLLYAWAWSVVGRIASVVAIVALIAATALAALAVWGLLHGRRRRAVVVPA